MSDPLDRLSPEHRAVLLSAPGRDGDRPRLMTPEERDACAALTQIAHEDARRAVEALGVRRHPRLRGRRTGEGEGR